MSIHESTENYRADKFYKRRRISRRGKQSIKSLSESYREIVDIKYSTHVFNGWKKGYSAIVLYR